MEAGSYTLSADDLVAANQLHWRRVNGNKRALLLPLLVGGFAGSLLFLLGESGFALAISLVIGGYYFLALISWILFSVSARRSWKQARSMWIEQQVEYTPEHIQFTSERGSVRFAWSDFYRWTADEDYILLYQTAGTFYTLPLRGFAADADERMLKLIREAGVRQR